MTQHQKLVWAAAIVGVLLYIGAIVWYDYMTHNHSKNIGSGGSGGEVSNAEQPLFAAPPT